MPKNFMHLLTLLLALLATTAAVRAQTAAPAAPAEQPTTNAAPAIRFQFDGIPYTDVIERFAQMASKPLISGTNVQGTLTYSDPQPYTYTEALDILNTMLSMKGVMLVDLGKNLQLVALKELPQLPHKILRGTDPTGDVRPGEVLTVVLNVNNLDAKEVADSVTPLLSNAGSVAALSQGRGLIVTDRLANIQRVRTLLNTIDTEAVQDRQMKTYTLVNASGAIVSDLLNRTFGVATAPKRTQYNPQTKNLDVLPPNPNDYITSVYDEASRTLVLFGPRERVGLAEELIMKFEQKEGAGGDVRIYYPQTIKPEELAQMIRQAIPGVAAQNEQGSAAATKARLIADPQQNRLIVAAPIPGQLDQIEQLINRVDRPIHGAGGQRAVPLKTDTIQLTKVFRPRTAGATNVATILQQVLTRRNPNGQIQTTASISYDAGSESVVVSGSPNDIQIATDIISQLETGSSQPTELETKFIDVGSTAEARRLQPLIEQLYRDQVSSTGVGAVAHAKIMADAQAGRLIVTATAEHLAKIEGLIQQFRGDRALPTERKLEIIPLENSNVDTILKALTDLVTERMSGGRYADLPKPGLTPDAANNRLLVTATPQQIAEIRDVVKVLDIAPETAQREIKLIPLKAKTPAEIIPLVTQLIESTSEARTNPRLAPRIMADPTGKQIIVTALPADIERVEQLVQQFDATLSAATARQMRTVQLNSRNAAEFTPLIEKLYSEQLKGQLEPAGGPATLIAEPQGNRIMISGSEPEIARVEGIIRQLDPAGPSTAREETRVLRLKAASAAELAGIVEKSLNAQNHQVRVLLDARSNSLIVSGQPGAVDAASQIIQQLDSRPNSGPRELRILDLKSADATTLTPMVESLFAELVKDARGADYITQVKLVPDSAGNRIIVSGSGDEIDQVADIVKRLDQAPDQAAGSRVFKLTSGSAAVLAPIVQNAMTRFDQRGNRVRRVSVEADATSNSLIVTGNRTDLQDVESVINQLDGEGGGDRQLKIIEVKAEDIDALAALATKVFAAQNPGRNTPTLVSITPEPGGRRLIVLAPSTLMPQVETVISTLDGTPEQGVRELHVIQLKNRSATEIAARVNQVYEEQSRGKSAKPAAIYADPAGKLFTVHGTAAQAASIRQIIETFDAQPAAAPRETRSLDVGSGAEVERLLPLVQRLYQDQWKDRSASDPADAQIMGDSLAGRIIVTGKPEHLDKIATLLQEVSAARPASSERDTRVYDLTAATAPELATTVRTLYMEEAKGRLGARTADTLILADPSANRIVVTGSVDEIDRVQAIIEKLDKVSAQSASTRVFKLKSANPDKVAEILSTALVRYDAYGRPQKRVSVVVDAQTRTLIATGDSKELQGVSVIIEQLDASLGSQPARQMKVLQVKAARVSEFSSRVRQLYADQVKNQPELSVSEALILDDLSSNQMIVAGSAAQIELIERIATDLQASQNSPDPRITQMIDVPANDDVSRVLPIVQQLYQEQWKNKDAADRPDAQLIPDAKNSRLIVTGRTNHVEAIAALVQQVSGSGAEIARETRIYDLKNSTAPEISTTLRAMYQEEARARSIPQSAQLRILPDDNANRLIVSGGTNELGRFETLLAKLDQVTATTGSARVFELKRANAAQVATVISSALTEVSRFGVRIPRVTIGTDPANNLLVVNGEPKDLQTVATLIERLDSVTPAERRQMRIFPITAGAAVEVASRVDQLYREQLKGQAGASSPDALIIGDETSRRLLVTATEAHLGLIEGIVKQLEEGAEGAGRQSRVLPLQNASATAVSAVLRQLFGRQLGPRAEEGERLVVSAMADDRTLFADGPAHILDRVAELLKTLDTAPIADDTIHTVHLKKGRAEDVATAISQSISSRNLSTQTQAVKVTAVSGANSLLITGPKDPVAQVMKIVQELDQESAGGEVEVRIYKLENGRAREVSSVLQQLLLNARRGRNFEGGRGGFGRFVQPSVTIDERSNSLIVSGSTEHFTMLEKILPTLDKAPERSDRDVQFVWLKKADAFDVEMKIENLFTDRPRAERPVIEADVTNNSLTIIARRSDMTEIQDLVRRLDESATDSAIQVRMRTIDSVSVEQMARMLQNIYPQMSRASLKIVDKVPPPAPGATNNPSAEAQPETNNVPAPEPGTVTPPEVVIAVDKEANALVLSGPAAELDNIDRLITDLAFSFYGNESEFRVFALKHADPVVVARMLQDLLRPEPQPQPQQGQQRQQAPQRPRITVVPEPRTRGVVVRARPTDFALLESIINQLDAAGEIAQVDFRVVPLTNASPYRLLPLVQQMVTQLNAARPGEPVSIMPDPRSRGLLVISRPGTIDQIEKMIQSLDTPAHTAEAEVMIVELKEAGAAQIAQLLEGMIQLGQGGQLTPENRELQNQVRRLKVQNDAGEAVSLDLGKPIKISAQGGGAGGNRVVLTSTPDNLLALAAVVQMLDKPAIGEGVEVRLVPLEHADASVVSQTLTTIFTQGRSLGTTPVGRAVPEGEPGKALTNPLNVAADARSNTLILSGRPESLDLALRVIKDLDQKIERFISEVRLYRLKHATATRVVPLLQSVFAEGPSVAGTEGLNTQVTRLRTLREPNAPRETLQPKTRSALVIQADDLSNTLVVSARADALPLIEDVIAQLDIPAASGLESVRVYPLNHADPTVLMRIISDLYTGPQAALIRIEDRPIISVDPRTSSLIVAGNSKAFGMLEGLLSRLDQELPFELRDIKILPLKNADASVLAATLQRMLDARVTQQAALNRGQTDSLKVIVIADERSNSLLIGGNKDNFELAEGLAKQLDSASPALSGQIRIVPLQHADARVMASTLTTLFSQRYAAARASDTQRNRPVVMADPRSNSLLVAATTEDNITIDGLLERLDRKLDNPALALTVLPLTHNDATRTAAMIQSIFTARQRALTLPGQAPLPSEQIQIEADAINNALIVSASSENLGQIQELLQKIDVEPVVAGGLLQIFTLQFADAQRVSGMISSLISQGLYRPGARGPGGQRGRGGADAFAVSVDARSNSLLVSASPENLAIVREVIAKLDNQEFAESSAVKSYALKNARASALAVTLTQYFQAKRAADDIAQNANQRSMPVSVIADDRTNTLLVTGGKEAFDTVERLLQQLDGDGMFTRMNFRVFPLQNATATALQPVLQQIFANRPPRTRGEPLDPITIVADRWVNALLVGASADDMANIESMIQRLDVAQTDTGIAIHVFPLLKADARRIATTVQSLYRDGNPGQGGLQQPISVSADERMNAIVVSAGENDAKRIGELIKKLDTDQVARVSEIKVFPLQYARADTLATILNTALNTRPAPLGEENPNAQSVLQFITQAEGQELVTAALKEGVLITPDTRMNSLIVSGAVDYMSLIEQIITRLDASSPQQAKIRVVQLQNADARQMADLLRDMFRMTQSTTGNARSINYTLIGGGDGSLQGEEALASATLGTAEQNALTVTVDLRTNSLLVGGTDHYVELVMQIINTLDATPPNERKTEVVRLKNSQAQDVATAIRTFLDQERQRVVSVLGVQAIGTTQRMLEQEIAVVAEPLSNTLLLAANPRYFMEIKSLIDELDKPQAQVLIQVLLAEVTLDALTDLGVEWSYTGSKGDVNYGIGTDFSVADQLTRFGGFSSVVAGSDFTFLLRALKQEGRLEVMSRPQIVTADNKPASINVGQRIPLITDSRVTERGDTINSFRYEDIGVNLTVTPKISPDGFVTMDIGTTNSAVSSATVQINQSATVPVINERRANTTVSVQSGQTVIIGGLISATDDERVRKIPWLGDIPYVGAVFRTKQTIRDRKELLVLLTPQILEHSTNAAVMRTLESVTREQLDNSRMKDRPKRDETQKELLEPLYPETEFEAKPLPQPKI